MRDANEGADIIMVKPGLLYLDVIANIRHEVRRLRPPLRPPPAVIFTKSHTAF